MIDLTHWQPLDWDPPAALQGRDARLERLGEAHVEALHGSNPADPSHWRYLGYGPFPDAAVYRLWAAGAAASADPAFYAVRGAAGWSGVAALMRIDRTHGVIEVGNLAFSPPLQRTPAATEAVHLLLGHCFGAGFRRVEWKCDARNEASRRAAERLGFVHEGTFRRHMVVRGEARDTAWFAMLAEDWPRIAAAHAAWLDPANRDAEGRQVRRLSEILAAG